MKSPSKIKLTPVSREKKESLVKQLEDLISALLGSVLDEVKREVIDKNCVEFNGPVNVGNIIDETEARKSLSIIEDKLKIKFTSENT